MKKEAEADGGKGRAYMTQYCKEQERRGNQSQEKSEPRDPFGRNY